MVRKIFFRHQKSLRHLAMTLTKYSISAHLGAPRRGLRGDVMVTCHGTKTRHGNTAKSHINVMVFPYRRERFGSHYSIQYVYPKIDAAFLCGGCCFDCGGQALKYVLNFDPNLKNRLNNCPKPNYRYNWYIA